MKLLPEKRMLVDPLEKSLSIYYEDITQYDIFESMRLSSKDFKDIQISISEGEGKIEITVPKERIEEFQKTAEKTFIEEEYKEKYLLLRDRLGDMPLKYLLFRINIIDPEKLIDYLPSRELLERDYEQWDYITRDCINHRAPTEKLLSIVLAEELLLGKDLSQYPEELEYHYYREAKYPELTQFSCKATFTKSEFLESVKSMQKQKELRKK